VLGAVPSAACQVLGAGAGCYTGTVVAKAFSMAVRRYQDLVAWQLANELKQKVYALVDHSSAYNDRKFCDQIKDSAASAPRNLAEGFAAYRHPEFARYTRIARSSLNETHNHLGDGVDRGHWSWREAGPPQELADRAIGAATRLLHYLETSDAPSSRSRRR
jgi:four helix bundle protein